MANVRRSHKRRRTHQPVAPPLIRHCRYAITRPRQQLKCRKSARPTTRRRHSPSSLKPTKMASLRRVILSTLPRILSSSRTSVAAADVIHRPVLASFSRSYSTNETNQSFDIDLSNEESKRRLCNRLLYRSKQRGFLELDLVLGTWVEDHIHSMDESGIRSLAYVLDLENPDLWKWLSCQESPPEALNQNPVFVALREKVVNNLNNHAAPETRAALGQPWVRGWDDFKKGKDSPITGNK